MKFIRILLLIAILIPSKQIFATHLMGGEITWECLSNGQYKFYISIYRDCSGQAIQPNGVFKISNYPTPASSPIRLSFTFVNGNTSGTDLSPTCYTGSPAFVCGTTSFGDPRAVREYLLETAPIILNGVPPPQGWILSYTENARNSNNNLQGQPSITLRAKMFNYPQRPVFQCVDNSPTFREKPTSLVCTGKPFTYNHNATDVELDSLSYEWAEPLGALAQSVPFVEGGNPQAVLFQSGFSYTNPFPSPGNNHPNNVAATLDSETGEISLTSFDDGKYVSVIKVTAYKCGNPVAEIYRELQSVFTSTCPAGNTKPVITPPFPLTGTPATFSDTFFAGDLINFNIGALDTGLILNPNNAPQNVTIEVSGLQFGNNFTDPNNGCPNPPCATLTPPPPNTSPLVSQVNFNWQTACNHVAYNDGCVSLSNTYTFVVRASDDACPVPAQNIATIAITILADSVIESPNLQCVNVLPNGNVELDWDLPPDPHNSFSAWMVYRGTNPNGPYSLIDSVKNYNTTTYTHVGANAQNQQSWYYIRSRSGCDGGVLNVPKDTIPTIFVSSTQTATCLNVSWNPLSVPNPTGSSNQYAVYREYPIGSGMSFYQNTTSTSICDVFSNCTDQVRYRIELTNPTAACVSSSNIHTANIVNPDPVANFDFSTPCGNNPIQFTDQSTLSSGTITSWSWDFGDGNSSTLQNPTHSYASVGSYSVRLTVSSAYGCVDDTLITVSPSLPVANAGSDQTICVSNSVQIGSPALPGYTYAWTSSPNNNTINDTTLAEPTVSPNVTTVYTLTVTDPNACQQTDQVTVTVTSPFAEAGPARTTCEGQPITIGGSPTGPSGATFTWDNSSGTISNPNVANPIVTPLVTTKYKVTASLGTNCSAVDSVIVTVFPQPTVFAGADRSICTGQSTTLGDASGPNGTYLWTPGNLTAKTPTVSPSNTTNYTVTYTDANGCIATDQVTVTVNPLPTVDAGTDQNICEGSSISLGGSPTGPTGSIYQWTNNVDASTSTQANPNVSPAVTTIYTVQVTDVNGCIDTDQVTITVFQIPTADAGTDQSICMGATATIGGSPTASAGSIAWREMGSSTVFSTSSNPTVTPSSSTSYVVTVEVGPNCTDMDTVVVTVNPLPIVDAGTDQSICEGTNISIGGSPTGPVGSTYLWTNNINSNTSTQANPTVSPNVTTIYTVSVTDVNACVDTDQMTVTVTPIPVVDAGADIDICIGGSTTLGGSPTASAGSIAWREQGSATTFSTSSNPTVSPITTTTYIVEVIDGPGCTASDTVTVTVNPLPIVDAGADRDICIGNSTTIGGSPTGPTGSTYVWTNNINSTTSTQANPTVSPSVTTIYTVQVTDANGCIDTDQLTVTVNPLPTVDAGADQSICEGSSITLGGSPTGPTGSTYFWTNNINSTTSTQANPSVSPTVTTTYTVQVTDANGCTDNDQVTITVFPIPTADAGTDQSICIGGTATIGGSPTASAGTIEWRAMGSSTVFSRVSNPNVSPSSTTSFIVTVTVGPNCTDMDTVQIIVNPLPIVDAGADQSICEGTSISIGGSPTGPVGSTYIWTNNINSNTSTQANPTVSPNVTTIYTVSVTDVNACVDTDQMTVTVTPIPVVDAGADVDICIGGSTTLGGSPTASAGSIAWREQGSATTFSTSSNPTVSPTTSTIYIVEVIDGPGCTASDTVTVTVNPLPIVDAGAERDICIGNSTTIGGSPTGPTGSTYLWTNNINSTTSTQVNPTVSPTVTTIYTVQVTDANGCIDTDQLTVTVNPLPIVDAGNDTIICINSSITLGGNPTGPSSATYTWTNNIDAVTYISSNPIVTPLVSTTYYLEVTDINGCINRDTIIVTVNPLPIVDAGLDAAICVNDTITLGGNPTGPTGSTFLWSPSSTLDDENISNPRAFPTSTTKYKVIVTDVNGCINEDSVEITVNPLPVVDAGPDLVICEADSIQIGGSPTGPAGVNYSWSNPNTLDDPFSANPMAGPIVTTEYIVTITDANGCINKDTLQLIVHPLPDVDFKVEQTCFSDITAFTDLSQLSSGNITGWNWDFGDGAGTSNLQNPVYQYLSAGTYTVELTVTTDEGCDTSISKQVIIHPLPVIDLGGDQEICIGDTIELGGAPTGPQGALYSWFPAVGLDDSSVPNPIAFPTNTTKYFLTVTDANACVSTDSITVTVNELPDVIATPDTSVCVNTSVQLLASGASTYQWTPSMWLSDPNTSNPISEPLQNISYIVTGTDINGCINKDTVDIEVFNIEVKDTNLCYGDSVRVPVSIQGDTAGIQYQWSPISSMNIDEPSNPWIMPLVDTRYYVTISNSNGCVDIDSLDVEVYPAPTADFDLKISPRCSFIAYDLTNNSSLATNYEWYINDVWASSDHSPRLDVDLKTSNTIKLIVSNDNCTDTLEKFIPVPNLEEALQIVKVNVFTPNGDGINDVFKIGFEGEFLHCANIQIYNRWGEKVYSSEVINTGWDGRLLNGELAPSGTYFYVLDIDGEIIKGNVYLNR